MAWLNNGWPSDSSNNYGLGWVFYSMGTYVCCNTVVSYAVRGGGSKGPMIWGVGNDLNTGESTTYRTVPGTGAQWFPNGEWHHYAFTYDGTTTTIYYDGAQVFQSAWPTTAFNTNACQASYGGLAPSTCGGTSSQGYQGNPGLSQTQQPSCGDHYCWFKGDGQGLRVFDSSLTAAEVQAFKAVGAPV